LIAGADGLDGRKWDGSDIISSMSFRVVFATQEDICLLIELRNCRQLCNFQR
jgi:hypothetical protein